MQKQPSQIQIDKDENNTPIMTVNTIKILCIRDSLPELPELNQKLYLYEIGFKKIEYLNDYINLSALWLNNNKITKIQNLESLKNLLCLYLNDNQISKIEGLEHLQQLQILNLQNNKISTIQNMHKQQMLKNFNISSNFLTNLQSIKQLKQLKNLTNLDISKNQIQNSQQIYGLFKQLKIITCLSAKATPFSRGFKSYRKSIIGVLPSLKFLDDRPVQQSDHRLSEAWLIGGIEQQKKQKNKMLMQQQNIKKAQRQAQDQLYRAYQLSNLPPQPTINKQQIKIKSDKTHKQKQHKQQNQIKQQKNIIQQTLQSQKNSSLNNVSEIEERQNKNMDKLWFHQYQKIFQFLIIKYKFDFSEVQPQFNMIIAGINKKLCRQVIRFEKKELQKIWTQIQIEKRKLNKI